jgi:hypothetical protein
LRIRRPIGVEKRRRIYRFVEDSRRRWGVEDAALSPRDFFNVLLGAVEEVSRGSELRIRRPIGVENRRRIYRFVEVSRRRWGVEDAALSPRDFFNGLLGPLKKSREAQSCGFGVPIGVENRRRIYRFVEDSRRRWGVEDAALSPRDFFNGLLGAGRLAERRGCAAQLRQKPTTGAELVQVLERSAT